MAAQIITIAIEKGGAGKTVTASNLAYLMGDEGKKVLCIDTDPQGNLTSALSGGNGITSGIRKCRYDPLQRADAADQPAYSGNF